MTIILSPEDQVRQLRAENHDLRAALEACVRALRKIASAPPYYEAPQLSLPRAEMQSIAESTIRSVMMARTKTNHETNA